MIPLRIGISACLLGDEVRFDGGHKRDAFLADVLGPQVEWVKVCPEVEVGMGIPREAAQLVRAGREIRMEGVTTRVDHTGVMRAFARRRVEELAPLQLCGYVLKSRSPSCGLDVNVYDTDGALAGTGMGLFASALRARFPGMPIEDEGRLADAGVRERFLDGVRACHRALEREA